MGVPMVLAALSSESCFMQGMYSHLGLHSNRPHTLSIIIGSAITRTARLLTTTGCCPQQLQVAPANLTTLGPQGATGFSSGLVFTRLVRAPLLQNLYLTMRGFVCPLWPG